MPLSLLSGLSAVSTCAGEDNEKKRVRQQLSTGRLSKRGDDSMGSHASLGVSGLSRVASSASISLPLLIISPRNSDAYRASAETVIVERMSAVQRKERLYVHLAASLQRLKQHTTQTADLFEGVQGDLDAMRTFAGLHAAKYVHTLLQGLYKASYRCTAS